jgi:hypothetical protein
MSANVVLRRMLRVSYCNGCLPLVSFFCRHERSDVVCVWLDIQAGHQQPGRFGFPGRVAVLSVSSDLATT